jgi:mannose-1-phosphate guanylyltransferase
MAVPQDNRVAVIMAGGAGERFWPYSRRLRPKQVLRLGGRAAMLAETIERVSTLIPPKRVLIVAGEHLREPILNCLGPGFPPENIVIEPMPRNTAACMALATVVVERRFGDATMAVLTADHVIAPADVFLSQIDLACRAAEASGGLITFGIPPTRPDTGFGYIEAGAPRTDLGEGVRDVIQFREKPDLETAQRFLDAGHFYWNSGMFCWTRHAIAEAFRLHQPAFFRGMGTLAAAYDTDRYPQVLLEVFEGWEKSAIDVAIMEKAPNRLMIQAKFEWDDIGSWTSLSRLREADADGNVVFHVPESSTRPLVATLGVKDLIIVVADDVVMICDRNRPQDVKTLLQKVKERGRTDLT